MKAIQFDNFGEPSVLKSVDIVKPEILPNEVLIKVSQIGVNYHETQRWSHLFEQLKAYL
ncbi:hypothetical protein ACWB29_16095 [Acinetobacter baumannii]